MGMNDELMGVERSLLTDYEELQEAELGCLQFKNAKIRVPIGPHQAGETVEILSINFEKAELSLWKSDPDLDYTEGEIKPYFSTKLELVLEGTPPREPDALLHPDVQEIMKQLAEALGDGHSVTFGVPAYAKHRQYAIYVMSFPDKRFSYAPFKILAATTTRLLLEEAAKCLLRAFHPEPSPDDASAYDKWYSKHGSKLKGFPK